MSRHRTLIENYDLIQTEAEYEVSLLRPEISVVPPTPPERKVKPKRRRVLGSQELNASPMVAQDTPKGIKVLENIRITGAEIGERKRTAKEKQKFGRNLEITDISALSPRTPRASDTIEPGQLFKPLAGSTPAVVAPERKTRSRSKRRTEKKVSAGNLVTGEMWDDEDEDRELEEYFQRKIDRIGRMIQKWKKFVKDNDLPEDYYEHLYD